MVVEEAPSPMGGCAAFLLIGAVALLFFALFFGYSNKSCGKTASPSAVVSKAPMPQPMSQSRDDFDTSVDKQMSDVSRVNARVVRKAMYRNPNSYREPML